MITKHIRQPARWVIAITVLLFVMAFLSKGFTHTLFLETGVFLVSIKLLLSSYQDSVFASEMRACLDTLDAAIQRIANCIPIQPISESLNEVHAQPAFVRSL